MTDNTLTKVSERLKHIASLLLTAPFEELPHSTHHAALTLVQFAWNSTICSWPHWVLVKEHLGNHDWDSGVPFDHFISQDPAALYQQAIALKKQLYPDDRRYIADFTFQDEVLQVASIDIGENGEEKTLAYHLRVRPVLADHPWEEMSGKPRAFPRTTPPASPMSKKVQLRLRKKRAVKGVDLNNYIRTSPVAQNIADSLLNPTDLDSFTSEQAYYITAQQHASILSDMVLTLKEAAKLHRAASKVEQRYFGDEKDSPVTDAYFTLYLTFDFRAGLSPETLGSIIIDVATLLDFHPEITRALKLLNSSRMGFYRHLGSHNGLVRLRELITGDTHTASVPAGYKGEAGELWLARVLPPPFEGGDTSVVFNTPYVIRPPEDEGWERYFLRVLPPKGSPNFRAAYEHHMKYGCHATYWPEYIMNAYEASRPDAIFLAGFPDIAESMPPKE